MVLNMPEPEIITLPAPATEDLNIKVGPPTKSEIMQAIIAMKNGKAAGPDGITAEMLKADKEFSTDELFDLFTRIWGEEVLPTDWKRGWIVKIPKKGDITDCNNYRGITLLSVPGKVFCRVLLNRIQATVDNLLRVNQAAYRSGCSTIDMIFTLQCIIEKCLEYNAELWTVFVDFRKAFDSVHRESLWAILRHYGIPQKIVSLIQLLYEGFECQVLEGDPTEPFAVKSGVRQGCILSPMLFCITIDYLMRKVSTGKTGIRWTLWSVLEDLDFADDLALVSTTKSHAQVKLDKLRLEASHLGLQLNAKKTEVLAINQAEEDKVLVDDAPLNMIDQFTYLGRVLGRGGSRADYRRRLQLARKRFAQFSSIWSSRKLKLKLKLQLFHVLVLSVLLYAAETWALTDVDELLLARFHRRCLRRILGIYWPNVISNEDLYDQCNTQDLSETLRRRRLSWLGHVFRMSGGKLPRTALCWNPVGGTRSKGRPMVTWDRRVRKDLTLMDLSWHEASLLAKDRSRWREITSQNST